MKIRKENIPTSHSDSSTDKPKNNVNLDPPKEIIKYIRYSISDIICFILTENQNLQCR